MRTVKLVMLFKDIDTEDADGAIDKVRDALQEEISGEFKGRTEAFRLRVGAKIVTAAFSAY